MTSPNLQQALDLLAQTEDQVKMDAGFEMLQGLAILNPVFKWTAL